MKTRLLYSLGALLFLFSCSSDSDLIGDKDPYATPELKGGNNKVAVCHYDSDLDEYQTLSISENAVQAHLNHGDYLGACMTSVIYDFNDCTLSDLVNVDGTSTVTPNGLEGCGAELNQARLETPMKYGYGTYEMDAKPLNTVSNQYLKLFASDDRLTYGIDVDVRAAGTDDAGLGFYVNGTQVLNIVGSAQMPVAYPNWYHVKVEVTPGSVKLWLDDNLMYESTTYGGMLISEGYWGIGSFSRSAFDNLVYTPL